MWILLSSRRTSPLVFDRTQNKRFMSKRLPAAAAVPRDQPQDVSKQISRDGDLGHLECDIAAPADDLRADFDKFLFQGRHRLDLSPPVIVTLSDNPRCVTPAIGRL